MEEHKIGEIFQHGDTWLQCVKGKGCEGCVFKRPPHCDINCALKCCGSVRSDKEDIIFKELPKELPIGFEFIYQDRKLRVEEYKGIKDETIKLLSQYKKCALCDNDGECLIDEYFPPCFWDTREDEKNIIYREVTDDIKETKHRTIKFKYMEPERKKLTIPEGWEFDKLENGEIILKTKEPVFPATLNDCCLELGGDGGIARGWGYRAAPLYWRLPPCEWNPYTRRNGKANACSLPAAYM